MKRRIISMLCIVAMLAAFAVPASALSASELSADTLYTLGLVKGTGSGYNLSAAPTRAEAITMIVRLAGAEDEAQSRTWTTPFTDVADWAKPYVGYAYSKGITTGTSATVFGSNDAVTANQYCTFLLRLMGYSESDNDFTYSTAALTCYRLGIASTNYASASSFDRGNMFTLSLGALSVEDTDGATLLSSLIDCGAVSSAVANAVGLGENHTLSANEVYNQKSSAVFFLKGWEEENPTAEDEYNNTATGFFISADGIAVTNCHAIADDSYMTATTTDGKSYKVTSVLYYDADVDLAVIRISKTATDNSSVKSFPYLEMVSSDTVSTGDSVYTLSCPLGVYNTITNGIVSNAKHVSSGFALPVIQNTASISMGSSGGALLNTYGQVIGVTSGYYYYGNDMYLAVPMDWVMAKDLSVTGQSMSTVSKAIAAAEAAKEAAKEAA